MLLIKNFVQVVGHLGQDPEITILQGGQKIARVSLATTEKWTDKTTGELREQTDWHTLKAFGPLAELFEKYFKKGDKVIMAGRLKYDTYEDKNGSKQVRAYIAVSDVDWMSRREQPQGQAQDKPYHRLEELPDDEQPVKGAVAAPGAAQEEDDLPF